MTVGALIALNRPDQRRSHVVRARPNGLTQEESAETITHLTFYVQRDAVTTAQRAFGSIGRCVLCGKMTVLKMRSVVSEAGT